VQSRGDRIAEVSYAEVIYASDGEEHWHGTAPDHFMTHLSFTVGDANGGAHVTDAEYLGQG
jgi:hypothetical protein